jgi:hypothetical protein
VGFKPASQNLQVQQKPASSHNFDDGRLRTIEIEMFENIKNNQKY